jgi:Tfp pilus assembly protein PilF
MLASGDAAGALVVAEAAIDAHPESAEGHYVAGMAALALGRAEDAADALQIALHFRPDDAHAHLQLGLACSALGRPADALASLQRAVELAPESAEVWRGLGLEHLKRGREREAEQALRRGLQLAPDSAALASDLGYLLSRLPGEQQAALELFAAVLARNPDHVDTLVNRGLLRQHLGEFDQALEDYEHALGLHPELHEARLNRGLIRLLSGDFARGWEDYEARKAGAGARLAQRYPFPQWDGSDLSGRTILIYGEQGLGDEIMFASCLPDIVARAGRVVLHCAPRLAPLMQRSFPEVCVHAGEQSNPDIAWLDGVPTPHVVTGIGSLPRYLRRHPWEFPRHAGYLRADPEGVARWRSRLAPLGGRVTIGVSWRGGTPSTRGPARSLALSALLPLLRSPGVRCVSLQYGDVAADLAGLRSEHGIELPHFPEAIENYDETAALLCALDGVVSICTAAIHLGGALGRPVRVLVPSVPEWRYLRSGSNLPWYPSIELLRQPAPGDWGPVIAEAVRRVAAPRGS